MKGMIEHCLWCGRSDKEVESLVPGPRVFICGACVSKMAGTLDEEAASLAEKVRQEVDREVQDSFKQLVQQLNLGPLQDKYQRLVRTKFKEDAESPSFQEVFQEFKKGVEAEVPSDDFECRYDLAIAYHEMGLAEDAYREMIQSLRGALRQGDYDRAAEVVSALLFFHGDTGRAIKGIFQAMKEAGFE